jgi:hypothetical protein
MASDTAPRAFISHATEDKDRFVLGFTNKLRQNGVDAWFDKWEIKPGDSLVQRIFEEGIKNAQVFLVIISSQSILKPWVREELDSGMVAKIQRACRLIPVIIDDCQVPQTVSHLKWVKIKDLNDYPDELSEILSAIFGTSDRPPIGAPPAHSTTTVLDYLPDLTKADNLVFVVLCRQYLKTGERFISIGDVEADLKKLDLTDQDIDESLEILASRGYADIKRAAQTVYLAEIYPHSLEQFMRAEIPDYPEILTAVISKIVNEKQDTTTALHESTGAPVPVILHILDLLEAQGLLESVGPAGLPVRKIVTVSAELKRLLHH